MAIFYWTELRPHEGDHTLKVAILFGGPSREHGISVDSGRQVFAHIDQRHHEVRPFYLGPNGQGRAGDVAMNVEQLDAFIENCYEDWQAEDFKSFLSQSSFLSSCLELKAWGADVAFLALHGKGVEDGTIQGFLEWAAIPYTGSALVASSLAFDKVNFIELLKAAQIPHAQSINITKEQWAHSQKDCLSRGLDVNGPGLPAVVKASQEGSSYGLFLVEDESQLVAAIESILVQDERLLWEQYQSGREFTCAIVGDNDVLQVFPLVEIVPKKAKIFDFNSKYDEGGADEIVPALLDEGDAQRIRDLACEVHRLLGCEGLTRSDFILAPDGRLIVLEINTLPGLTAASICPRAIRAAGIEFSDFIDTCLNLAVARGAGFSASFKNE